MKAITMRIQKFSPPGVILMATVVVIITSICVANAAQTITTPNAAKITYNLAAGANSAVITPATNTPVLLMGCCTSTGGSLTGVGAGIGQVSLLHGPAFIEWSGLESLTAATGGATITSGANNLAGTHVVYIDVGHHVDIQLASKDTIVIHNGNPITAAGNVTLIW